MYLTGEKRIYGNNREYWIYLTVDKDDEETEIHAEWTLKVTRDIAGSARAVSDQVFCRKFNQELTNVGGKLDDGSHVRGYNRSDCVLEIFATITGWTVLRGILRRGASSGQIKTEIQTSDEESPNDSPARFGDDLVEDDGW